MINAIIFSKDRASQLTLLLESIERYATDKFVISVLYKSSTSEFRDGYELSKSLFPNIRWVEESNFKQDTLSLLSSDLEHTCFFTDDDVFYSNIGEVESHLSDDVFCFSFRLGENVTHCYTMNSPNKLFQPEINGEFMKWDWTKHYLDFGYPLSLDGHVFKTKDIKKLVNKTIFNNPNTLEGNLQMFEDFPKQFMVSYKQSRLVGIPNNRVNDSHPNLNGQKFGISAKELNDKFLSGKKIDLLSLNFIGIFGCHQEIKYEFTEQ